MEPPPDFKSLQDGIQKSLVSAVKTVNRIAAEDLSFQRTVNPDAAEQLDEKSARILDISNRLLQSAARACGVDSPQIDDAEDIDMKWQAVVDVVDSVLEKADTALDEYTGLVKRKDPTNSESTPNSKRPKSNAKVIRNANVVKPQLSFDKKPDNFPDSPWKPILQDKPHASVTLDDSLVTFTDENGSDQYKHPYESEIKSMAYPDRVFKVAEPIPYKPVDTTSATYVDTFEGVLAMLKKLEKAKEIAVDLEHHDFRTYTGLVSLMQISTRDEDWIVDTLKPWRHKLEVLNNVFADPKIVKVFHGAYMDMVWLQRDLGLYVNGLFDTYFACQLLYSGRSLAFLLSKFVDFEADKQYQLADWRIRPIPEEMLYYARSDTHYLLYIYDRVRNDLVSASDRSDPETDLIGRALEKSRELSMSRHVHADYNEETGEGPRGWYNYVLKHSYLAYNGEQFAVFKAIWKWRDETARKEDESPNFVLGTANVADIARVNPPDAKALHSLLPLTAPLARARLNDIWDRVQAAKAQGGLSLIRFFAAMAPEGVSTLPKMTREIANVPDLEGGVLVSRLNKSRLFGEMPISTLWDGSQPVADSQDDQVPYPWQRFVSAIAEGSVDANPEPVEVAKPPTVTSAPKPVVPELDEEFTLKRGKKRKSDSVEEQSSSDIESQSDEDMGDAGDGVIEIEDESARQGPSRKQRKKEKRAKKRQEDEEAHAAARDAKMARKLKKKEEKELQMAEKAKKYNAVPFDYSQAASVMNAKREPQTQQPTGKQKKIFNPYAKAGEDGLKGARKAPPIRGERSATFKK